MVINRQYQHDANMLCELELTFMANNKQLSPFERYISPSREDGFEHFTNAENGSSLADRLSESSDSRILVLPGGGMRGVYSAAALARLEQNGLTASAFNRVIGLSAGAINGAYYVANQMESALDAWISHLPGDEEFIRLNRPNKIMDVNHLHERILPTYAPLDEAAVLQASSTLDIALTRRHDGQTQFFSDDKLPLTLREMLKASSSAALVYEGRTEINGHEYIDGGFAEAIPLDYARSFKPDHIVIIGCNPLTGKGVGRGYELLTRVVGGMLDYPEQAQLQHVRGHHRYNDVASELRSLHLYDRPGPVIDAIFPKSRTTVHRLDRNSDRLRRAATQASQSMAELLAA